MSDLPDCFAANYDSGSALFTIKNAVGNVVNQQCLLTVLPRPEVVSASRRQPSGPSGRSELTAGSYTVYLGSGGGGGAGGTAQAFSGGGGGAGAIESQGTVNLTEGTYKLTIGAGGPGGNACVMSWPNSGGAGYASGPPRPDGTGGGPGWVGSPSSMVRVANGEVVMGTPGADLYVRPSRARNERMAGKMDGHGGSGPGQASGGDGGRAATYGYLSGNPKDLVKVEAESGDSKVASGNSGTAGPAGVVPAHSGTAGAPGVVPARDNRVGAGGGGGATSLGEGGGGGGERSDHKNIPPERGALGGGGGGGKGNLFECDPGAPGGHGYIALRPN
jgi:hypothetical protein